MMQRRESQQRAAEEPPLGIAFVYPPNAPAFVPFRAGTLRLGRNPACGVPLDGRAVSWEHAELRCSSTEATIRDLGSTNGVVVNGAPVTEARLDDGSLVRLGDFLGVVSALATAPEPEPVFPEAASLGMHVGAVLAAALDPLRVGAQGSAPLVIEGETGTGKTLTARLVHAQTRRRSAFFALDCGAFDEPESVRRLFGEGSAPGALDQARSGTLYLGNVTSLAPSVQDALARALLDRRGERLALVVGSQEPLATALADRRLLPHLYDQLDGVKVRLPPLRRRLLEIPTLFRRLIGLHGRGRAPDLSTELVERLCLYDWPCNVREMVLLVQRLVALHGDEEKLRSAHLPARMMPADRERTTSPVTPISGVDPLILLNAVREAGGNVGRAAVRLGISRDRAYRLIDRLGLGAGRVGA